MKVKKLKFENQDSYIEVETSIAIYRITPYFDNDLNLGFKVYINDAHILNACTLHEALTLTNLEHESRVYDLLEQNDE